MLPGNCGARMLFGKKPRTNSPKKFGRGILNGAIRESYRNFRSTTAATDRDRTLSH